MRTLPLSEVKAKLSEIAEEVDRTRERIRITKNGRDYVVLISADDLESMELTLEFLENPEAVREHREAEEALARGEFFTLEEVRALMDARRAERAG